MLEALVLLLILALDKLAYRSRFHEISTSLPEGKILLFVICYLSFIIHYCYYACVEDHQAAKIQYD